MGEVGGFGDSSRGLLLEGSGCERESPVTGSGEEVLGRGRGKAKAGTEAEAEEAETAGAAVEEVVRGKAEAVTVGRSSEAMELGVKWRWCGYWRCY